MKLVGRQDRVLLAGLAVALIVAFARPLRYALDAARDVEQGSGLVLVPALFILACAFAFHQQMKRHHVRAGVEAAQAGAQQAETRAIEMERLAKFGQALGRSLEVDTIRDVVLLQLPKLAGTDEAWVMTRTEGYWSQPFGASRDAHDVQRAREQVAHRVLGGDGPELAPDPILVEGHLCIPLMAGGHAVGVLAVPESAGPFSESRRRHLATAAALLAISIRHAQLSRDVRENSLRDALTGCFNRTHALEVIDTELRRARRSQMPVALIMFDLDRFKDANDRHGPQCGDALLAEVGAKMHDVLRRSDVKCRFGGQEFLVLLPETPLEGAKRVADTLRREIADIEVPWRDETVSITASFGVTMAMPSEIDAQALIGRADMAMYRAKDQGRNCVRLSVETVVA